MDRDRFFEIFPKLGVAEIKFGMSVDEVATYWGAPDFTEDNNRGDRTELRDTELLTYDKSDNTVAEIGFSSHYQNVTIHGVKIFQLSHDRTIQQLHALDADAYKGLGFVVFKTLGISLSGFRGGDFRALTVTAFKDGCLDSALKRLTPLA